MLAVEAPQNVLSNVDHPRENPDQDKSPLTPDHKHQQYVANGVKYMQSVANHNSQLKHYILSFLYPAFSAVKARG